MDYIMIDGVPTSKTGIAIVKKCRWCGCLINPCGHKKEGFRTQFHTIIFCSEDCRQEEKDWDYVSKGSQEEKHRTYNRNYQRAKNVDKKKGSDKKDRTEYFKIYFKKNRQDRLKKMREYMKRRKLSTKLVGE